MPKHSSKSDEVISPDEMLKRGQRRRLFVWISVFLILAAAAYMIFKPKSLAIEDAVPSGILGYVRLDDLVDQMKSLRSSKFWDGVSKLNVPGFFEHENVDTQRIKTYVTWRDNIHVVTSSPLFKQFLGREVVVALYPQAENFSNGSWPPGFSGLLLIARPEAGTRLTEMLGGVWNQYSKDWESTAGQYKNVSITAIKFKKSGVSVFYARVYDLLAVAVDERVLHTVIDTVKNHSGTIREDERFVAFNKRFYAAADGQLFLDMPRVTEFLNVYGSELFNHVPDEEKSFIQAQIEHLTSGLRGIQAAGASYLTGKPMRIKSIVTFDPARSIPELNRLNNCPVVSNSTVPMIPKDAIAYQWTGCVDFPGLYKEFTRHVPPDPDQLPSERPFAELEKTWNLNIENDILPVMGSEFGWYVQGIEAGGFLPFPKFVVFLNVKDPKAAEEILKRIITTPLTLVQNEEYRGVNISFVTVPLLNSFRPGYAFVKGYLVLATSNRLLKQSLDVLQDPSKSLSSDDLFKEGGVEQLIPGQMISFVRIGEISRQSKALVDWADNWFSLKIQQAEADEKTTSQKLQVLNETIQTKTEELLSSQQRLEELRREKTSLEMQVQAAAVTMEAKDTLSQEGAVKGETKVPEELRPERMLEYKRSQLSALELQSNRLQRDVESMRGRLPDLADDLSDLQHQELDAKMYQYYVDEVVSPVLHGLESLVSKKVTASVKDGVIESEMFLIGE